MFAPLAILFLVEIAKSGIPDELRASYVLTIGARFEPVSLTITEIIDFAYGDDFQKNADTGKFKEAPQEKP